MLPLKMTHINLGRFIYLGRKAAVGFYFYNYMEAEG